MAYDSTLFFRAECNGNCRSVANAEFHSIALQSATRERMPPGPSNRAKVAIKWINRTTRVCIAES